MNLMIKLSVFGIVGLLSAVAWCQEAYTYTKRENSEWFNISINEPLKTDLPHVLLIGDSITGRYCSEVAGALKGKVYLSTLATSKPIGDPALFDAIKMVLKQNKYDVVHFNNGLHGGMGYTNDDYKNAFPEFIATIKAAAPGAKLIWATSTPCRSESVTKNVVLRNQIAAEFIAKENILVDDLYQLVINSKADWWDGGGVHFTAEGTAVQSKQVAQCILSALPAKP